MKPLKGAYIDINKLKDVIALCTFGSYNEKCWDKDRSDIDIMITFINGFVYPFGEIMIASPNKLILETEKYLDYVLGYSVFKRDN